MMKIQILVACEHCDGEAYLPVGEATDFQGQHYIRYSACPTCNGTGNQTAWISMEEFARFLSQAQNPSDRISHRANINQQEKEELCKKILPKTA